jgi:large subunit ribosomal protein L30
MAQLKVKQLKSGVGRKQNQRDTLRSLGLRKIHQEVVREDDAVTLGMIQTVRHLVTVEEVS